MAKLTKAPKIGDKETKIALQRIGKSAKTRNLTLHEAQKIRATDVRKSGRS